MLNKEEASKYIGKSGSYFGVLKSQHPIQYRFITLFGKGDYVKGYYKYQEYKQNLTQKFTKLYMQFKNSSQFGQALCEKGYEAYHVQAIAHIDKIYYSKDLQYRQIKKAKYILRLFEELP